MKRAAVRSVLLASLGTENPVASSRRVVDALALHARRGKPAGGVPAELMQESLAKALGIQSRMLAPISGLIDKAVIDGSALSPQGFLDLVEAAAMRMPEFFSPSLAIELADALEGAMGTAALVGVRDVIRQAANKP